MITIATLLWDANAHSQKFSSMYDESWVEKLLRGFARNLNQPFRFICYTDRPRVFKEHVEQRQLAARTPDYGQCVQPYELGEPMILVGLDTIVTGNVDALADYALAGRGPIALPRDPYNAGRVCNGVALVPAGHADVWTTWRNGVNDMVHMRLQDHVVLDDLFPGQVQSYKGAVRDKGLGDTRIVYFHGREKPHEIQRSWVREHWL